MNNSNLPGQLNVPIVVDSGDVLGVWSLGIIAHLRQKVVDSLSARKIHIQKSALRCSLGLLQTIILAGCLVQTATAKTENVATNLGAAITSSPAVFAVEINDLMVFDVAQLRQQNIHLRAELAAALRSGITNRQQMAEPQTEKNQQNWLDDWHWLLVICLLAMFVGSQIGAAKTPNVES
jgi:D-alanyl-lipoteichoic acid acyltransferase DltB (MBOAT superfamily)